MTQTSQSSLAAVSYHNVPENDNLVKFAGIKASFICASLLAGCSDWPRQHEELKSRFLANREEIQLLTQLLERSMYSHASLALGNRNRVIVTRSASSPIEEPDNAGEWRRLFEQTGLDVINEHEGDFHLELGTFDAGERISGSMSYVRSSTIRKTNKECTSKFENVKCGDCIVNIEKDWWIRYLWHPFKITPDMVEALLDADDGPGLLKACYAEGSTYIYNPSKWPYDAASR